MREKRKTAHHIIPAAPGWYVIEPVHGGDFPGDQVEGIHRMPIVAWIVHVQDPDADCLGSGRKAEASACTYVSPVGLHMSDCGEDSPIIQTPDGLYVEQEIGEYDTEERLLERLCELEALKPRPERTPGGSSKGEGG